MSALPTPAPRVNRKPRPKPTRTLRLDRFDGGLVLTITMSTPRKMEAFRYHLRELAVDFGRGWELDRPSYAPARTYHVHLDAASGDSCTCRGFVAHGHCKHRDAVAELVRRGLL